MEERRANSIKRCIFLHTRILLFFQSKIQFRTLSLVCARAFFFFIKCKIGRDDNLFYFFICLFYLKRLCLMRALVKIGFYYHKQHLRSKFNYIYFYFKPACVCVCIFSRSTNIYSIFVCTAWRWSCPAAENIIYFKYNIMCKDVVVCVTPLYECKQERGQCLFSRNYHVSLFVGGSSVYCTIN